MVLAWRWRDAIYLPSGMARSLWRTLTERTGRS